MYISYDCAVTQLLTSCHKIRVTTRILYTLVRTRDVIDNVRDNNALTY